MGEHFKICFTDWSFAHQKINDWNYLLRFNFIVALFHELVGLHSSPPFPPPISLVFIKFTHTFNRWKKGSSLLVFCVVDAEHKFIGLCSSMQLTLSKRYGWYVNKDFQVFFGQLICRNLP